MSTKQRAVILQIPNILFIGDMECGEFADLLNDLPEGTTMIGIREDLPTNSTLISIQNDRFIETEECQHLPRVRVSQQFEQNDDGGKAYLYWDLDPVMEKETEQTELTEVLYPKGISTAPFYKHCFINSQPLESIDRLAFAHSTICHLTQEVLDQVVESLSKKDIYIFNQSFVPDESLSTLQKEFNQLSSQMLENQAILGQSVVKVTLDENNNWKTEYPGEFVGPVQPTCEHEWKQYVGLTESYNYCNKCDLKDYA